MMSSGAGGMLSVTSGNRLMPQLPAMMVVTPCVTFGSMSGDWNTIQSSWVWVSINPGATIRPVASISVSALAVERLPIATISPSITPTSAARRGAPVPSMMSPLRMSRSYCVCIMTP
ncbi:hypothetical protein D3C72_2012460 [compost metagenome]